MSWQSEQKTIQTALQKHAALVAKSQQEQQFFVQQEQEFYTLAKDWKTTHKLLLSLPDKKALEEKQQTLNQQLTAQQELLQKNIEYKEQLLACKQKLHEATHQFEKDFLQQQQTHTLSLERLHTQKELLNKQIQQQKQQLEKSLTGLKITQSTIAIDRKMLPAELLISDFQEQQTLFNRHKMLYQKWIEQGNWVNTQIQELQSKQSLSQDPTNPSCPLCEQNLSQARKRFLQKKFIVQTDFLHHRFNRLKKSITLIKSALQEHHTHLQKLKEIEQLELASKEIEKEIEQAQMTISTAEQALIKLNEQEAITHKTVKTLLDSTEKARLEDTQLKQLTTTITTLETTLIATEHNQQKHKVLITQLKDVQSQLTLCNQTNEYQATQKERLLRITKVKQSLKQLKYTATQLEAHIKEQEQLQLQEKTLQLQEKR
jgi:hypothetical protein